MLYAYLWLGTSLIFLGGFIILTVEANRSRNAELRLLSPEDREAYLEAERAEMMIW